MCNPSCEHRYKLFCTQQAVLEDENMADVPVAILLNKIDLAACIGEAAFVYQFDLFHKRTGEV